MKTLINLIRNPFAWLVLALLLAVGLKTWLVAGGWVSFNSDEAVVALMARHILNGARPTFFYGQAYMGSLDAFLVALAFKIFGEQVWAIRLVQILLYSGVLACTVWLGKKSFGDWRVGAMAALLLAIPAVNVTLYTTVSLGGYGEALLLGNLILLCALQIVDHWRAGDFPGPLSWWVLCGWLSGLGLWAIGLTLVYSLPAVIFLVLLSWRQQRKQPVPGVRWVAAFLALGAGALLGAAPWWLFALKNGFRALLVELTGGAIAGVEGLPWIFQVFRHTANLLLFGSTATFGLRPPWDVTWLALPLLPFVLMFWMGVIVFIFRSMRTDSPTRAAQALLAGVILTLMAGFVLTPFGADPSGRYFLPLAIPLSLFAAALVLEIQAKIGRWALGLALLLLVYNLWGTLQSALRFPPGITTQFYGPAQVDHRYDQALIDFLRQHAETRGYGNYWVAYPLAFLSGEDLIFVPRLPYHPDFRYSERDDRYLPYDDLVSQAQRVAYITTNHPDLDENLRMNFKKLGVTFQEIQIGDYDVFYALSQPVRPAQIGLGTTTNP
jgi:4-amino-4-deoxy-L-arabinose transferase-like glycosyltransferase